MQGAFEEVLLKCTHMSDKNNNISAVSDCHKEQLSGICEEYNNMV